jgi:uncharacterized Zn finger protein
MPEAVACEHCAGQTEFITELAPLGGQAGHRVFRCMSCRRYIWATWRPAATTATTTGWNGCAMKHGEPPPNCPRCGKPMELRVVLPRQGTLPSVQVFRCQECGEVFTTEVDKEIEAAD